MNMPFVDKYDTQSAIELMRQSVDYKGWFDKVGISSEWYCAKPCYRAMHRVSSAPPQNCLALLTAALSGCADQDHPEGGHQYAVLRLHESDSRFLQHHTPHAASFCHLCGADAFC